MSLKRLSENTGISVDLKKVVTNNRTRSWLIPQQPHLPAHRARLMPDLRPACPFCAQLAKNSIHRTCANIWPLVTFPIPTH